MYMEYSIDNAIERFLGFFGLIENGAFSSDNVSCVDEYDGFAKVSFGAVQHLSFEEFTDKLEIFFDANCLFRGNAAKDDSLHAVYYDTPSEKDLVAIYVDGDSEGLVTSVTASVFVDPDVLYSALTSALGEAEESMILHDVVSETELERQFLYMV